MSKFLLFSSFLAFYNQNKEINTVQYAVCVHSVRYAFWLLLNVFKYEAAALFSRCNSTRDESLFKHASYNFM